MARRHFDDNRFPKLDEIIKEICVYIEGLEIEYTDFPLTGNVIDPRDNKYGNRVVSSDADFVQGIPERPFKVNGIYVVGWQVPYLPNSYNKKHNLDLLVKTNAERVTFSPQVEGDIWYNLESVLEHGKDIWTGKHNKFALHVYTDDEEAMLDPPYLQIYPTVKKVV